MSQPRNSQQIRTDALKMAIRKAKTGCHSCAQSYFELAKKHGATEEEISRAISTADETGTQSISRRHLIQLAAAAVAGATLAAAKFLPQPAQASSYFWGTDSNSETMLEIPQNFYIGRFGYGTTGSSYFFNTTAARWAGKSGTFMYWGLEGPGLAPPGTSFYSWGQEQASAALSQRFNNPNALFVGGYTIFADIEAVRNQPRVLCPLKRNPLALSATCGRHLLLRSSRGVTRSSSHGRACLNGDFRGTAFFRFHSFSTGNQPLKACPYSA